MRTSQVREEGRSRVTVTCYAVTPQLYKLQTAVNEENTGLSPKKKKKNTKEENGKLKA